MPLHGREAGPRSPIPPPKCPPGAPHTAPIARAPTQNIIKSRVRMFLSSLPYGPGGGLHSGARPSQPAVLVGHAPAGELAGGGGGSECWHPSSGPDLIGPPAQRSGPGGRPVPFLLSA